MNIKTAVTSVFLALGLAAPVALMAQVQGEKLASDKSEGTKPAEAAAAKLLRTDSPTPYVHRLTLYDHAGQAIDPSDADAKPYSPKMTCGKCHPYAEIAKGWHFNHVGSADVSSARTATTGASPQDATSDSSPAATAIPGETPALPDRPGEPWILADARLGIQIPLSLRGWPGTFFPAQIGLSAWQFTLHFGRHLCGGGFAEGMQATESGATDQAASPATAGAEPGRYFEVPRYFAAASDVEKKRWAISGGLEIDCMMCHATMSSGYDAGEVERQVERQNLRWSATAALGLGLIRGDAKSVSNDFDPENPAPPDRVDLQLPKTQYEKSKFDGDNRVLFEIARKPPNERCTFCHATRHVGKGASTSNFVERDVHLSSGLSCADCHRNGIDHATQRGIIDRKLPSLLQKWSDRDTGPRMIMGPTVEKSKLSQEIEARATPASFSCAGCHSTIAPHDPHINARLGAPIPAHAGIPPLHFEKLSCTACHAGPLPEYNSKSVQTALAHGLGVSTKERKDDAPPIIYEPIFRRDSPDSDGSGNVPITPTRTMFPAFWAFTNAGDTSLATFDLIPQDQLVAAGRGLPKIKGESFEQSSAPLSSDQIEAVLVSLLKKAKQGDQPVYIVGDRIYSLHSQTGKIGHRTGEGLLKPYAWPIAHEVRPAGRALGVAGCTDCHSESSVFSSGRTLTAVPDNDSPFPDDRMSEVAKIDSSLWRIWSRLLGFRAVGKLILGMAIATLLASLFGRLGSNRLPGNVERIVSQQQPGTLCRLAILVTLIGALLQLTTALVPARFENLPLLVHSAANPIFTLGLVAWAILWSRTSTGRATPRDWVTWLTLCAGLGVMVTMLLAMLPLFSTDAMRDLFAWHKYFGIAVLVGLSAVILLSFLNRPART